MVEDTDVTAWSHDRLEDVYREESGRLWRALVLHTGDRELAADSVSEAFAQALRRGEAIRDPARWIWKTAFLLADRQRPEESLDQPVVEAFQAWDADAWADLLDLFGALQRLTPRQRASVVLHYYVGYSLREVADIIGSTRAAVGVHLFRARERLRKDLGSGDE